MKNFFITQTIFFVLFFFCKKGDSQILYTDVIPDSTISVGMQDTSDYMLIDINQDSIMDFALAVYHTYEFHSPNCCDFFISSISVLDTNSKVAVGDSSNSYCTTAALDSGELIDNHFWWESGTYINFNMYMFACPMVLNSLKYYPVKLFKNGNYYFGWIRLYTTVYFPPFGSTLITLYDMAVNLTPNQFMYAAQTTTGVNESSLANNKILIFPNPAGSNFSVIVPDSFFYEKNSTLSVYDYTGRLIQHRMLKIHERQVELNLESTIRGIYNVSLSNGKETYNAKVVLE